MLTTWLNTFSGMKTILSSPVSRRLIRSATADFELSPMELFDRIACFDHLEAVLRQKGINVIRIRPGSGAGITLGWDAAFQQRGKLQHIRFAIEQFDKPARISGTAHIQSLEIVVTLNIMALSRNLSRLAIEIAPRPRDLRSHLVLHSLGLQADWLIRLLREVITVPDEQAVLQASRSETS